jgi:hypothetical protein
MGSTNQSTRIIVRLFISFIALIIFFSLQTSCFAQTIELQWTPNTETDLVGYKVYYKADTNSLPFDGTGALEGASPIDVRNQTTATITGLEAGRTYYFAVSAYNASGVESVYSKVVTVVETLTPTIALTSPANYATVSGNVSINATTASNAGISRVEYYINGILNHTDTSSPYVYSWNTSSLVSGNYTVMAKIYDVAGNIGQSSNVVVTVANDQTAPVASIASPVSGATVRGTVSITASASDAVGVTRVEFYGNGALLAATNMAPYVFAWDTTSAANGSYSLAVKAYDNSGNVGLSSPVMVTVANDSIAPSVAISAPVANATISGIVAVNATATDNVGVTKVEFYLNGVLRSTATIPPYSYNWDTRTVANGSYNLTARAYDAAGNVTNSSIVTTIVLNDAIAPSVSITKPTAGATVSGMLTVQTVAADNVGVSRVEFCLNGKWVKTVRSAPFGFEMDSNSLANGSYTLTARAYDVANNASALSSVTITVFNDAVAPTVMIAAPVASTTVSGLVTVLASASDNTGVTKVEFYVNGLLKYTANAAPFSYTLDTNAIANGQLSLVAKAYDAVGNVTTSSAVNVSVFNDTIAPTVSFSSLGNGASVSGTIAVAATAADNVGVSKVEFYVNGVLQGSTSTSPYAYIWDTLEVANGSYTLSILAYDAAGNVGQSGNVTVIVANDLTAPILAVTAKSVKAQTISGTVSDNVQVASVKVTVGTDGVPISASIVGTAWTCAIPLTSGLNTILVTATDSSGNSSSVATTMKMR